jgi:hypothetical protein
VSILGFFTGLNSDLIPGLYLNTDPLSFFLNTICSNPKDSNEPIMKKELSRIARMLLKAGVKKDFIREVVKVNDLWFLEYHLAGHSNIFIDYRKITQLGITPTCVVLEVSNANITLAFNDHLMRVHL